MGFLYENLSRRQFSAHDFIKGGESVPTPRREVEDNFTREAAEVERDLSVNNSDFWITPVPEGEYLHYTPYFEEEQRMWFFVDVGGRRHYQPLGYSLPAHIQRGDDYDPVEHAADLNRLMQQFPVVAQLMRERGIERLPGPPAWDEPEVSVSDHSVVLHRRHPFGRLGQLLGKLTQRTAVVDGLRRRDK